MTLSQSTSGVKQPKSDRQVFVVAVLNLTWQMALVVLVPIIGGYELDHHFSTLPLLTIGGFVLASFGVAIVLWRQLQIFGPPKTASTQSNTTKTTRQRS